MEDLSGRTIKGYQLQTRLGEGAYGAVYRASQPQVKREVAIKIILPEYANRPDFIRRFEAEAQLVAQLEHLHIVPLYDYWREPGGAYLVMRLMKGGSLEDSLRENGPWEPIDSARLVTQIASALEAAHKQGVVHRDLKPANILLDEDSNAYLSDFGIAKEIGVEAGLTQTGAIMGTPAYITPEQVQSQPVSAQTDIYTLGVVLYELLVGGHPFLDTPTGELVVKHLSEPLPLVRGQHRDLPIEVDQVIQKATAKDPENRYPDAVTMASEYRRAMQLEVPLLGIPEGEIYNPYKGLRAFQEADADDFFGREALIGELLARLVEPGEGGRFLAVVGPSGSGKSSVVKAGLVPALRKGALPGSEEWFIIEMMPGAHPLEELEVALLRIAVNPPASLLSQMKEDKRGLLRAVKRALPSGQEQLLLVVDQFEELFTLVEDKTEAKFFIDCLCAALIEPRSPVNVIITLRADFYDRPLMYPSFSSLIDEHTALVLPLTAEQLERAIREPAERVGIVFEKGLMPAITADVVEQPGALPLLQYALTELFERREGRMLTNLAYQSIGGVLGALGRRAEEVYDGMDKAGQVAARQLFLRLVTLGEGTEDTRRRVLRSELEGLIGDRGQGQVIADQNSSISGQYSVISRVIDAFGEARLLTFDRDPLTRAPTVEVAHEALLREWRRLWEWLDENRADVRMQRILGNAAGEWVDANQDLSFLLRGTRLAQFEDWAKFCTLALTQEEQAYLDASLAAQQARQEAEAQRRQLELGQISIGLAGQALNEIGGPKPERAVLLALEALEHYPHTWQAKRALAEAVLNHRLEMVFTHDDILTTIELSQDGALLLTGSSDGTTRVWDTASGEQLLVLSEGKPQTASWSPDETAILSIGSAGFSIQVWNISRPLNAGVVTGSLRFIEKVDSELRLKSFNWFPWSPKGNRFVTAHDDGARIWDAVTGKVQFTLSAHEDTVIEAAWSPSGDTIVTTSLDNNAILWDAATGKELKSIPGTDWGIKFGDWSPSGDRFSLRGFERVSVYETATGAEVLRRSLPGLWTQGAKFSPDGNKLITTAYQDGTARLWDVETGELYSMLSGLTQGLGISWSPSGEYASVVGADGSIRIWDTIAGLELQQFPFFGASLALWSPAEDRIYAAGDVSKEIRVFKLSAALSSVSGMRGLVGDMSWSPNGSQIGQGYEDGTVVIWDSESWEEVMSLETGTKYDNTVKWSPSGDRILTTNFDSTTRIWDASSGELLLDFDGHERQVFSGAWSPDGCRIVTTEPDGNTLILWEAESGEEIWKISVPGAGVAIWSPDGTRLAVTTWGGEGTIRNAATGEVLLSFFPEDYPGWVEGAAWSSDGERMVVFSKGDGWIFDTTNGDQIVELSSGFTSSVWDVYWSPGDELIFTIGGDGTYRVFEAATGIELLVYDFGGWPAGALSPDGKQMVIGTNDGKTSLYPTWLTTDELIAYARECCLLRELTAEEREIFGLPER